LEIFGSMAIVLSPGENHDAAIPTVSRSDKAGPG